MAVKSTRLRFKSYDELNPKAPRHVIGWKLLERMAMILCDARNSAIGSMP